MRIIAALLLCCCSNAACCILEPKPTTTLFVQTAADAFSVTSEPMSFTNDADGTLPTVESAHTRPGANSSSSADDGAVGLSQGWREYADWWWPARVRMPTAAPPDVKRSQRMRDKRARAGRRKALAAELLRAEAAWLPQVISVFILLGYLITCVAAAVTYAWALAIRVTFLVAVIAEISVNIVISSDAVPSSSSRSYARSSC